MKEIRVLYIVYACHYTCTDRWTMLLKVVDCELKVQMAFPFLHFIIARYGLLLCSYLRMPVKY